MIERAREFNRDGERVRFHHNNASDLRLFADGSFDFVLALIVLQHMPAELMRGYIREFLRVLRPAGVAFFNIPERFEVGAELPPEAWRASLALIGRIPTLTPGQIAPVRLKVRNESPAPVAQFGAVAGRESLARFRRGAGHVRRRARDGRHRARSGR